MLLSVMSWAQEGVNISSYNNMKIDGYRGLWFPLGRSEYGYKYSGGFGTYTVKHDPLAVYSKRTKAFMYDWLL